MRKIIFLFAAFIFALTADAQFAGGKGTAEDPYQIADAYQLADMQNYRSSYFKLINDIDLTEWIEDNSPTLGWSPIGSKDAPFTGDFNGNGFTISGLMINRPNQDYIGLFGYMSGDKSIRNIHIISSNIIGKDFTGVICGYSKCDINICEVNISNLASYGDKFGGICGMSESNITGCKVFINDMTSSYNGSIGQLGGICGLCYGSLKDNIIIVQNVAILGSDYYFGGIAGNLSSKYGASIDRCYVVINKIHGNYNGNISGICGCCGASNGTINIKECYVYINAVANHLAAGIASYASKTVRVGDCIVDGYLESNRTCGIFGGSYVGADVVVERCLVLCHILKGNTSVSGVSDFVSNNSVCVSNVIESASNLYRISASDLSKNNKAYINTKMIYNGIEIDVADDAKNGTALGEKTLKRASTYVGLGWDMVNTWKINEGEDYPYLRILSDYPTITKYETTNNCRLTGTSPVNGKIYVMKDGATYTSDIVDNTFEINVGAVNVGDTLLYFSMPEGGKPSVVRRLVLTEGTTDPSGDVVKGDANGDSVIDAADVVGTINYILGKPSSSFNQQNADINEDGQILVDDAVGTVNVIMNNQ